MSARNNLQKLLLVVTLVFSFLLSSITPPKVQAADCTDIGATFVNIDPQSFTSGSINSIRVTVDATFFPDDTYFAVVKDDVLSVNDEEATATTTKNAQNQLVFTFTSEAATTAEATSLEGNVDTHHVYLFSGSPGGVDVLDFCKIGTYDVSTSLTCSSPVIMTQTQNVNGVDTECTTCFENGNGYEFTINGLSEDGVPYNGVIYFRFVQSGGGVALDDAEVATNGTVTLTPTFGFDPGTYTLTVEKNVTFLNNPELNGPCQDLSFSVVPSCPDNMCSTGGDPVDPIGALDIYSFCKQINDSTQRAECESCLGGANGTYEGVWTAVGCISREPTSIARTFIRIGLSMSGGVALLMILAAGFILTTAEGNPKKASDAKEMVTAAIVGLVFVIFSVVILQFIGFTVLQIPGFGG